MKRWAYYNDIDPYVCQWVRNLIRAGHIMDGEVQCRVAQLSAIGNAIVPQVAAELIKAALDF